MEDEWYDGVGRALGVLAAVVTFIGCWIYCMANYGFLLGFGLGWLPSGIAAALTGLAVRFLWGLAALLLLLGVLATCAVIVQGG